MSTRTSTVRSQNDHFTPEDHDSAGQRKLRGHLEQIDYTAFAANKETLARTVGRATREQFQRLALAAAIARAQWAKEALRCAESGHAATADEIARLDELHRAFTALSESYEGLRRMVERGYLVYDAGA